MNTIVTYEDIVSKTINHSFLFDGMDKDGLEVGGFGEIPHTTIKQQRNSKPDIDVN